MHMSLFCQNCGAQLSDNAVYCANCGEVIKKAEPELQDVFSSVRSDESVPFAQAEHTAPQNASAQYVPQPQYPVHNEPPQEKLYPVASVGGFFWRTILFAIPVVGLICCIIMAFAPQNPNVRNHARAYCIFWIIAASIALTCLIIMAIVGGSLFYRFA